MNIIIEIYIISCVLLLLFDIGFIIVKNGKKHKFYPKNTAFESRIRKEIGRHREEGVFSDAFSEKLHHELAKTKNLITLQTELEQDSEAKAYFHSAILGVIGDYQKKSDYEQAYYTYVLTLLDYLNEEPSAQFSNKFMSFLESKSLYTFTNAMMVLYQMGQPHLLLQALDKVNAHQVFYHKKLLVDGLLTYKGDREKFNTMLMERFNRYTPYMQDSLLDYFRLSGSKIAPICRKLIQDPGTEQQVQYSAMRYFIKYPDDTARQLFLDMLSDDQEVWIKQLLAIQALGAYNDPQVRSAVYKKVTSPNWFVRSNAIAYLHDRNLTHDEVFEILFLRDKYSNEALLYQYSNDLEMSRYIINTIQLLEEQARLQEANADLENVPMDTILV